MSAQSSGAVVGAANDPPALRLKTTPPAAPGDPYPVISGKAPFTVKFNLCESSDPDQVILPDGTQDPSGDSLNWQFHFGDDGTEAFNEDGTFNPNFEHFCRTEHTYAAGLFVATATVTDKHLEDQSNDVTASARVTQRVTIVVVPEDAGGSPIPPVCSEAGLLSVSDPNHGVPVPGLPGCFLPLGITYGGCIPAFSPPIPFGCDPSVQVPNALPNAVLYGCIGIAVAFVVTLSTPTCP